MLSSITVVLDCTVLLLCTRNDVRVGEEYTPTPICHQGDRNY
jgi:hypothetical protein